MPASQLGHEFRTPPPFQTYPHPLFPNKKELWNISPMILDPSRLPDLFPEATFHSALFRLDLTSTDYLDKVPFIFPLRQGSTIVFQGFENTQTRYIVEWCQLIQEGRKYLKVTGLDRSFNFIPYNDPYFPSFILILPIRFADVPLPGNPTPFQSPSHIVRGFEIEEEIIASAKL